MEDYTMKHVLDKASCTIGALLIALAFSGCFRPMSNGPLIEAIDAATVPTPDDYNQLQAAYWSPDMRALISVFSGTTLPNGGLAIAVQDLATLDAALGALGPNFAVDTGPDGTQFNVPVRISTVIGKAIRDLDGALIMPNVDVYTSENGQAVPVEDVAIDFTEDDLVVVHALLAHFSPVVYRVRDGLAVSIDDPPHNSQYLVGASVPTQLTAYNTSRADIWVASVSEDALGSLGMLTYDTSQVQLDFEGDSSVMGKGSCKCTKLGDGVVFYTVNALGSPKAGGKGKTAKWKRHRSVECIEIYALVTVLFDPELHTTSYAVQVYLEEDGQAKEITIDDRIVYNWEMTGPCAGIDVILPYYAEWEHGDCDAVSESQTRIKITVRFTDETAEGQLVYDQPGRANEGAVVQVNR
jgi:hypothetical protein